MTKWFDWPEHEPPAGIPVVATNGKEAWTLCIESVTIDGLVGDVWVVAWNLYFDTDKQQWQASDTDWDDNYDVERWAYLPNPMAPPP